MTYFPSRRFLLSMGKNMVLLTVLTLLLPLQQVQPDGFTLEAIKTEIAPSIDGVVDSTEWSHAATTPSFIQYEPQRGMASEVATQGLVLYDENTLYVAFRLAETGLPTAQLTLRNAELLNDDAVILVLDGFNDRRSAYYFMTNALGTQTDGRIANDGR